MGNAFSAKIRDQNGHFGKFWPLEVGSSFANWLTDPHPSTSHKTPLGLAGSAKCTNHLFSSPLRAVQPTWN